MIESTRIAAYLYTTLANDATLAPLIHGVAEGVADPGTPTPYVVFFQQASTDTTSQNGYRLLTQEPWMVEVVGTADDFATLQAASDRIDTLLGLVKQAPGNDGMSLTLVRDHPTSRIEVTDGIKYLRIGGQYRVTIH